MSFGIKVSRIGFNADTADEKDLSFTSDLYMHTIAQTGFEVTNTGVSVYKSNLTGFLPILIGYKEDVNNLGDYGWGFSGEPGISLSRVYVGNGSGAFPERIRYYLFYQEM